MTTDQQTSAPIEYRRTRGLYSAAAAELTAS